MKTIYNVSYDINPSDVSTFEVRKESNKYFVFFEGNGWTPHTQGVEAARLKDTGDDVKIKVGNKKITLDYSELEEVFLLLTFYNNENGKPAIQECICECLES